MRRLSLIALSVTLGWSLLPVPGVAQTAPPAPNMVLKSDNVSLITSLPNPGVIGARFKGTNMFVTTVAGLTVYDVSNPAAPVEIGRLPLPHFENEDVDLGGNILLISNDAAESAGILYVIDISDPTTPVLRATHDMGGNPITGGPGHTASCIKGCNFAWVTDGGKIRVIDLRNPDQPANLGTFEPPTGGFATHDVQTDANGLAWVAGYNGTAAYRIPAGYNGPGDERLITTTDENGFSTYFDELGLGDGSNYNDFIHHNSRRLRDDDVVFITEEDYTRPACQGAGSFEAWRLPTNSRGIPTGAKLSPLGKWQTELVRDNTATAAVCSAHYFDVEHNLVAQGWYEQGVRFLDVSDPSKIRQVGYFVPPTAMTWAAYFPPTDPSLSIVYVFDATHGIDVVSFARPAKGALSAPHVACRTDACRTRNRPSSVRAPIRPEWLTEQPAVGQPSSRFGFACRTGLATI